jgi:hypothetical protein
VSQQPGSPDQYWLYCVLDPDLWLWLACGRHVLVGTASENTDSINKTNNASRLPIKRKQFILLAD